MLKKKSINASYIKKVKTDPEEFIKGYSTYRKNENIEKYNDNEIKEMVIGIFKNPNYLMIDEGYFIPVDNVIKIQCALSDVTFLKGNQKINDIQHLNELINSIRTFYIKDFFMITENEVNGSNQHGITEYFFKMGGYNRARGKNSNFYNIPNDTKLLYKDYPVDLYYPVKRYIEEVFYRDAMNVFDFEVVNVSI